ncbi:MAG: DNA topoisomerase [Chthoniobacteraceae bacterium]
MERIAKKSVGRPVYLNGRTSRIDEKAPLPPTLGDIQIQASSRHGWSPSKMLDLLFSLYESHKAITYPATNGRFYPPSHAEEVTRILEKLGHSGHIYRLAAEDASVRASVFSESGSWPFQAIAPTVSIPEPESLTGDEKKAYVMVAES